MDKPADIFPLGFYCAYCNARYTGSEAQVRVRGHFDCPACSHRNTPFDLSRDETEPPADED